MPEGVSMQNFLIKDICDIFSIVEKQFTQLIQYLNTNKDKIKKEK